MEMSSFLGNVTARKKLTGIAIFTDRQGNTSTNA